MEGGSLFNAGVLGNNFLWWIGQIADDSTWRDNIKPGKFQNKDSIAGWGRRYKVRIIGIHDKEEESLPSENLPWANVMYPITAGGGQTNSGTTPNLRQGMFVFGFWMDGQDMQVPVIMGVLGNNAQTLMQTKIGNNDSNFAATSGYAEGKDPPQGTAKPIVPDEGKVTTKPKSAEASKEEALLQSGSSTNKYGLKPGENPTKSQLRDIQNARGQLALMSEEKLKIEFGTSNPSLAQKEDFVKNLVTQGIKRRVAESNAPGSPSQPGATKENTDAVHELSAGDVKREDKYQEKTVLFKPDDPVDSATKAIQTIIDNLTRKLEKNLAARSSYIDAVAGGGAIDMSKLMGDSACQISKYMKIIMDKMMEYVLKSLNKELTTTVSAMPSSLRYQMADMKYLTTQNTMQQYGDITNKVCGLLEGMLKQSLDVKKLEQQADEKAKKPVETKIVEVVDRTTGITTSRTLDVEPVNTYPKVPICYAEDLIGQAISSVKSEINDANNAVVNNMNAYLNDVKGQLQKQDSDYKERTDDQTKEGQVLEITDEEGLGLTRGGSWYLTEKNVGVTFSGSVVKGRGNLTPADTDGVGLKVDITVTTGGISNSTDEPTIIELIAGGSGYKDNASPTPNTTGSYTATTSGSAGTVNIDFVDGVVTRVSVPCGAEGSGYNVDDEVTITGSNGGTGAKIKVVRPRGKIDKHGIKIASPGTGYLMGDQYSVDRDTYCSVAQDATILIVQTLDKGPGKADSGGPPSPLGDMNFNISSMVGNLTAALSFDNMKLNMFPFELPPNPAVSDFYTLARGGAGQPQTQMPSMSAIGEAAKRATTAIPTPQVPFLEPGKDQPNLDLTKELSNRKIDLEQTIADTGINI